jgi:hypothetical protein
MQANKMTTTRKEKANRTRTKDKQNKKALLYKLQECTKPKKVV